MNTNCTIVVTHAVNDKDVLPGKRTAPLLQGDVPWKCCRLRAVTIVCAAIMKGRYRDKNAISGQLEYRHKLSCRHGVVGWVGAGTMGSSLHPSG
ncbi:Outer membrane protein/protective antigen OMA87 [Salmonella enterica subsp. enterica]|uniref:Outer membrane protein/protective antigen OMA87 n=1 Tax=Salmonella enterica I TaxID=59201 RepID=A0A447N1B5_SALET|nr:Outer membrane protein/protective antigen OMA87 [Salmonella enterica subsp. enterica]